MPSVVNDIRKKHQAPKGWFGHAILVILGVFLLCQPWFLEVGYWPVLFMVIPVVLVTISHFKKRRRKKIIESKKKPAV